MLPVELEMLKIFQSMMLVMVTMVIMSNSIRIQDTAVARCL